MSKDIIYHQYSLDRFPNWEYEPKLRRCLLDICLDNPCEALLLDYFYADTLEYRLTHDDDEKESLMRWRGNSLGDFDRIFGYLFTQDQIYEAILSLAKQGWVDFQLENLGKLGKGISFYAQLERIEEAILQFRATRKITTTYDPPRYYYHANRDEVLANEIRAEEREIIESSLAGQAKTLEEVQCHRREMRRIVSNLYRDKARGVSGTLTLTQWLGTLEYFSWRCAYCKGPYEVLEHFIPVTLNGATSASNCVPACNGCNSKKNNKHPLNLKAEMGECIEQVQQYLMQFEHA